MHGRVEGVFRVRLHIAAQRVDVHQLHRPVDGDFQIAQVQPRRIHRFLQTGARVQGAEDSHGQKPHGKFAVLHRLLEHGLQGQRQRLLRQGQQVLQEPQGGDAVVHGAAAQAQQGRGHGLHVLGRERRGGHIPESVGQDEGVLPFLLQERPQQRPRHGGRLGGIAAFKEAPGDGLEGVGNPLGVAGGDPPVGVQALEKVALPDLGGFVQKRHHPRRQGRLGGVVGQLLAVAGAGVGENLPHELSGTAADVALMVHEELIEELQRLLLAGGGHIGAVLVQEPEIRADGGRGALPPRLFEKQVEGLLGGNGVHQAHVALEGHPLERLPRLPGGEQRRIPVGHGL